MKRKKKVLVLLISATLTISTHATELTFKELAKVVSADLNASVYVDKDIEDYTADIIIADHQKRGEMTSFFTTVLFDHDMYLKYNPSLKYYTVVKKKPQREVLPPSPIPDTVDEQHYYTYKIRNITNQDVVKTMSIFPKSKYVYLEQSDMISYSCTTKQHEQIHRMLSSADNKSKEALIKITIFSTNKNKIKSYGSDISKFSLSLDSAYKNIFNSIVNSKTSSELALDTSLGFGFTLFALQGQGLVDILQEPTIRISNGKLSTVLSGLNIGYLESSTSVKENQETTTDQIKYRDVGIQIKILPKIKNNWVHIDLDLISEELLSLKDNIPLTQKIRYKSSVTVTKGKPLLLTGIKKVSSTFEQDGIPILQDIPYLGELFKKQTKKNDEQNINILIEVL